MWYVITFAIGALSGFGFGMFFYRNNKSKMTKLTDTINNLKDQIKKKKE